MQQEQKNTWVDMIPKRILLIESDRTLANMLQYGLIKQGYQVEYLEPGSMHAFKTIDLVIMDSPGIELYPGDLLQLLSDRHIPIIELIDKSSAHQPLSLKASHLLKPFDFSELLQLIDHSLGKEKTAIQVSREQTAYRIHNIEIYPSGSEIRMNGSTVHLTWREFQIFVVLLDNQGKLVSSDQLQHILSERHANDRNALTLTMFKLRNKCKMFSDVFEIKTIIKNGYQLDFK
ncbi:response regulator transcription factor [Paenibacillus solisilvae]|uniref:Response regulator transcription factor n=1 Tax=Paenibacillus solisilvae TaxID=2486751 RepID=A0ABW0VXP3_9BACL